MSHERSRAAENVPATAAAFAIAVLAKEPVPGRVKTRLCPPYSAAQAADLAAAALADTLDAVAGTRTARRCVLVLEGDATASQRAAFEVLPQRGGGLDERIANALVDVSELTGLPVLLVGMDTPQLHPALLERAGAVLVASGAVLGPATDGGYWALGLSHPRFEHVLGVAMSTPDTGRHQVALLTRLGAAPTLLETLTDVDDSATARAVADSAPQTRFARLLAGLPVAAA